MEFVHTLFLFCLLTASAAAPARQHALRHSNHVGAFDAGANDVPLVGAKKRVKNVRRGHGGRRHKFSFQDCGSDPDRPIRFLNVEMSPRPLTAPGKVKVKLAMNVTRTLPDALSLDVSIKKDFFGFKFPLPCMYGQFGSCLYEDICYKLSQHSAENGCPYWLEENGLPCNCAALVERKMHKANHVEFFVPTLESVPSYIAEGEYEAQARFLEEITGNELGCLKLKFFLRRKPCRGKWWCDLTW